MHGINKSIDSPRPDRIDAGQRTGWRHPAKGRGIARRITIAAMTYFHRLTTRVLGFVVLAVLLTPRLSHADLAQLTGTWLLDEDASGTLESEVNQLKQETRDYAVEHGGINDPDKPDPFGKRRYGDQDWERRRTGLVTSASIAARQMLQTESLKLYIGDRIILSYDGKLKRRVSPNPSGRVYSATGKGISQDTVGQTLAYLEEDALVIETRTNSAEFLVERFEPTDTGELKVTAKVKNPEWRREVEFVRYFLRQQ